MAGGVACRACGVVLPGRVGLCPSCGGRSGLGGSRAWVGPAVVATIAALALATIGLTRRPRVDPALAKDVQVYTGIKTPTPDYRATNLTGFIENNGRVPVDVTVRVRCRDVTDRIHDEFELRPFRNLAPGSSTPIRHTIATIPIAKVEMDLAGLAPSPPR